MPAKFPEDDTDELITMDSRSKINVGDTAEYTKIIDEAAVTAFAELTGDFNPFHLDAEFARTTRFGRRIAHGMLSASLFSTILANQLPGCGTLYLSQNIQFIAPVFLGDTITARVTVLKVRTDKPVITLETVAINQHDQIVVKGEAVVLAEHA